MKKLISQNKDSVALIAFALGLLIILMTLFITHPKEKAKIVEPIQLKATYIVSSYSEKTRSEGDAELHDTTINYIDKNGIPQSVTVTDEIISTFGQFGKLLSKDSQQLFVGTTDPKYSRIIAGNNIAYAKYIDKTGSESHIVIEIDEANGIKNFTLFLKE